MACLQSQADMAPERRERMAHTGHLRTDRELTGMCWGCSIADAGVKIMPPGHGKVNQRHETDISK